MPSRNRVKEYETTSYYHIYTRGVNKHAIFHTEDDYSFFLGLLKRYLSPTSGKKKPNRVAYKSYADRIQLISYALMPNHIHLFVYQEDMYAIRDLMRAVLTSYSMYFNHTYKRVGPLFQSRYLASRITEESYFEHITRYIHMNPKNWQTSTHTSLDYFLQRRTANWIHPERVLDNTPEQYLAFLRSYNDTKAILDDIKWSLANSPTDPNLT